MGEGLGEVPDEALVEPRVVLLGEQAQVVPEQSSRSKIPRLPRPGRSFRGRRRARTCRARRPPRPEGARRPRDVGMSCRYRIGCPSLQSSLSTASTVPCTRGSVGDKKPTSGISKTRRRAASIRRTGRRCPARGRSPSAAPRLDLGPAVAPALDSPLEAELFSAVNRPIEGHPGHHLRVRELAARPADLPDALVGLAPVRSPGARAGPPVSSRRVDWPQPGPRPW